MFIIPKGAKNITINMCGAPGLQVRADNDIQLFTKTGVHLAGTPPDDIVFSTLNGVDNSIGANSNQLGFTTSDEAHLNDGGGKYDPTGKNLNYTSYNGMTIGYTGDPDRYDASPNDIISDTWEDYETLTIDEVTEDLIAWFPGAGSCGVKAYWDPASVPAPNPVNPFNPDLPGGVKPTGDIISIDTQDKAQQALERIDNSIVIKDKVRANLGATQNRLENTVTNLTVQAENLQAAEARISDADVGIEMMLFVRNQILTQAGVAMLSQANSLPQMMAGLLSA
ncbi:flagellin [uncultured Desulfovibrio sp.]|uniref:flagellin n=1 Tax=uncultured Desulfovibrio sp. TaxID=167968 RepID=UPI0026EB5668|nr:flagellin [uncultured Desulfovibrio sp.]